MSLRKGAPWAMKGSESLVWEVSSMERTFWRVIHDLEGADQVTGVFDNVTNSSSKLWDQLGYERPRLPVLPPCARQDPRRWGCLSQVISTTRCACLLVGSSDEEGRAHSMILFIF